MNRRDKKKPPRPGMKWSRKHQVWVDADTRTPERRAEDEEILKKVETDRKRLETVLRNERRPGLTARVEDRARHLALRFLESLVKARDRAGLSQADVARRMGVPQPTVARIEAGTHSPTLTTLARYASAIGVALDVRQPA